MKPKGVIVALFLVAVGVIVFVTLRSKGGDGTKTGSTTEPAPAPAPPATEIVLVYSTEKKDWLEMCVQEFEKTHPAIKVTRIGKGSFDAAQEILDERLKPTLFSPADTLALRLLEADWELKQHRELLAKDGDDAPQPLVITPLVFVVWEDRAEVLAKVAGGTISWKTIHKAVSSNRGWPEIGGKPEWGFVKLGHTDPTRSNSGLQALLLMTLEFYGRTSGLEVGDVLKPELQAFVKAVEKGVTKFETSTGTFMTDMVRFGPSKYDIAVVYESLAISQLENAQGRWGNLKVYYPATTIWSDHPVALLQADWVTDKQKQAARELVAYLRSRPAQERALAFGFRPADPAVPIRSADLKNPWVRLEPYGVKVDIPQVATLPDAPVVRNLMMMWSRVVGAR